MADDPVPEPSVVVSPEDGATGVTMPCTITWNIGNYTEEIQVLVGTQYPPTDIVIDWTDQLVESTVVNNLLNNKTYFVQVNGRNSAGTTEGIVSGFTTIIDVVSGLTVVSDKLYPGDAAVFNWNGHRSFRGYNFYQDGEKINDELITEATYVVEDLTYNMDGYAFQVSNVYDEGESELSNPVYVYVTGFGTATGTVYEQDSLTPIANATIKFQGTDVYSNPQNFTFTTDDNGVFEAEVYEGTYAVVCSNNGYVESQYNGVVSVSYNQTTPNIDLYMHEVYSALNTITAEVVGDNVEVTWAFGAQEFVVDFETGDFSQAEFNNEGSTYPWAITTSNPYEGSYCMKSTCEGVNDAESYIEATVTVPFDAKMGFQVKTSTESSYDKFHFYIDGVEQGQALSGESPYTYKEYSVAEGTHTYKWSYIKDYSVNGNDDCVYVDNIVMYREDIPAPPIPGGQSYDFEDGTMMGWTAIDADGDGFNWELGSSLMGTGYGHDNSSDLVLSQSYDNSYGVLYPDNYLVSPGKIAVQDGAYINFYACAQDASYASEHFGVAVSTGSATPANFTMVQEWTMSAKGMGRYTPVTRSGNRAQGTWYQYTVDLSDYAGQEIWVALRHFNCSDWFYLDVDDIVIADGSAKDRALNCFYLYRQNVEDEEPILIATPNDTTFNYTDTQWSNLPMGLYQWGIQAYYEGNRGMRDEMVYYFENGMQNWTALDADGDGYGWLSNTTYGGHNGSTGIVYSMSYVSGAGALNPDNYLISPAKATYSQIHFWACAQDASWPSEHFGVAVSTADNPSAADFTTIQEWTMTAKSQGQPTSTTRSGNRVQGVWYEYTVDLSAYAGQDIWVAIRHFNCSDWFYLNVDDITLTTGSGENPDYGPGMSSIIWSNILEKDMYSTVTVNVALNSGQPATGTTVELVGEQTYSATVDETNTVVIENVHKGDYLLTVAKEGFESSYTETPVTIAENEETFSVMLYEIIANIEDLYVSTTGWAMWSGNTPGGDTPTPPGPNPPTPGEGEWYYYDDGAYGTSIGTGGGQFSWGVMFPAGSYQGDIVTKVAAYNASSYPMTGTVTVYNNGSSAPSSPVGEMNITFAGVDDFTEYEFPTPVTIDPTKNLWIVFYNASGATYPAAASNDSGDPNGRWVSIDGVEWMDLADAGVPGYCWMLRAYVANAKGEVTEISVPQRPHDGGQLAKVDAPIANKGNRAPLVYKVMLDGTYAGDTENAGFQFNCEGLEEGSQHVASVLPVYATGEGEWTDFTWTYKSCENYAGLTEEPTAVWQGEDVVLNWVLPEGGDTPPTPPNPPTPGEGNWYNYDDGFYGTSIGTGGGQFSWGVMFPAGSYQGDIVTKVAAYNASSYPMTGTVTVYNNGSSAPSSPVGEMNITFAGVDDFTEYEFPTPVTIDPTKNLWIVFYNASGATYPAAASNDSGDPNGRWVSIDGVEWMDLADAGVPGYCWMLRAYVASGSKGEVTELSVPQRPHDGGQLATANGRSRDGETYDFESGMMGWTSLDADGDGFGWDMMSMFGGTGHNNSSDGVFSQSYDNTYGVLYPDNYLVSPAKGDYSAITFYACAQDASYAAEHFGVAVSTGSATAADFTTIQEWTMSAKGTGTPTSVTRSGNRTMGNWYEYSVDLSAYAGQEIWVAIRHFNCSDMFYLDVDDISFGEGGGTPPVPPVPPTGDVYDFEDGTMMGWSNLDADGDGFGWQMMSMFGGTGHNNSSDGVFSQSYDNTYGVLYPDNYLVSPAKDAYRSITFYACAQDASYAAEHFGVAVSTGNATAAEFTTVQEWTMSAKSVGTPTSVTRSGNRTMGNWYEYTVDLSAYAGQQIWVAIRHFNCSDWFYLDVDDISLDNGGGGAVGATTFTPNMFNILVDGVVVGATSDNSYMLTAEDTEEHTYQVVYVDEEYNMSCPAEIVLAAGNSQAPFNLEGQYVWDDDVFGAQIEWSYGVPAETSLYYDNGTIASSVGEGDDHLPMWWGIMIPAADLANYSGATLNKVAFYEYNVAGTYTVFIHEGGDNAPGELVYSQDVESAGSLDWNEVELETPVEIDPAQNLWIIMYNEGTIDYPATCCTNTGDANGRWISEDGENWYDVATFGLSYTWMVRGIIDNPNGGANLVDPTGFNVYRDNQVITTVPYTGEINYSYFDNVAAGNYTYQVSAVYSNTCESDYALTTNGNADYVQINVTSVTDINENVALYPNPTNGMVTIEAAGMNHITVVSALGQVVYDADINADMTQLNLGQFKAGIYMVRINTENGVGVKRVTVVK